MRRILALALTATATVGGLAGCATATTVGPTNSTPAAAAAAPEGASGNQRCIDWVSGRTPRERYAAADTVVVATIRGTGRAVEDFAVYPVHRATDVQVLKGAAPEAFDVIVPTDRCEREGEPVQYLEGDPLDGAGRAVLYLRDDGGTRRLITPDALDVVAEGAPLPDLPRLLLSPERKVRFTDPGSGAPDPRIREPAAVVRRPARAPGPRRR